MLEEKIDFIRELIYKNTNMYVVDTDNNYSKLDYPFYSYKITSFLLDNNQAGAISIEEDKDKAKETMTLDSKLMISFNAYSNTVEEAYSKILALWELFKFKIKQELSSENIVIVNISNIQDRTINIIDHYEYRYGFDVEIRLLHKISREIGTIESYDLEEELE